MNERLNIYLSAHPHEVLPSAAKNYPTYSQSATEEAAAFESPGLRVRTNSGLGKGWKKSIKLSRDLFRVQSF